MWGRAFFGTMLYYYRRRILPWRNPEFYALFSLATTLYPPYALGATRPGVTTMSNQSQKTILCIISYEKGQEFMRECKRRGSYVILLTVTTLENANWPRESIDEL